MKDDYNKSGKSRKRKGGLIICLKNCIILECVKSGSAYVSCRYAGVVTHARTVLACTHARTHSLDARVFFTHARTHARTATKDKNVGEMCQ